MQKAIDYHGVLLMPGSYAYDLYHSKEKDHLKQLDKHMKELEQKNKDLIKRYE